MWSHEESDRSAMRYQAYTEKLFVRRLRVRARMQIKFSYNFSRHETSFQMIPVLFSNSRTIYWALFVNLWSSTKINSKFDHSTQSSSQLSSV